MGGLIGTGAGVGSGGASGADGDGGTGEEIMYTNKSSPSHD